MMKIIKYLIFVLVFFAIAVAAWWMSIHVSDIYVIVDNAEISINSLLFVFAIVFIYLIINFISNIIIAIINIPKFIVNIFRGGETPAISLEKALISLFSNNLDAAQRNIKNARHDSIDENLLTLLEAQYYKLNGNVDLAIDQYNRLSNNKEYRGFVSQELSLLYEDIGATSSALEFAKQAFDSLKNQDTLEYLINCHIKLNQWGKVLALLENSDNKKIIGSNKADELLYLGYYRLSLSEYKLGVHNEALFLAETSKKFKTTHENLLIILLSSLKLNDPGKVIKTLAKHCGYLEIIEIFSIIEELLKLKSASELLKDFKKNLDMSTPNSLAIMAKLYALNNKSKEANAHIDEFLAMVDASEPNIYLLLAENKARSTHHTEIAMFFSKLYHLKILEIESKLLKTL